MLMVFGCVLLGAYFVLIDSVVKLVFMDFLGWAVKWWPFPMYLIYHRLLKMSTVLGFLFQVIPAISFFALPRLVVPGHAFGLCVVISSNVFTRLPARSHVTCMTKSKGIMFAIAVAGGVFHVFVF